jgi:hypothetical protein
VKKSAKILLPAALALLAPTHVFACATCYGGNIESPMTDGMNLGIFTLLGVIGTVLLTFGAFLIFIFRKSAALAAAAQKPTEISKV